MFSESKFGNLFELIIYCFCIENINNKKCSQDIIIHNQPKKMGQENSVNQL